MVGYKNLIAGRPVVAGYNWILSIATIFEGHFLKKKYYGYKCCANSCKLSVLLNIFMDDAVGICYGTIEDIVYWTKQFNLLRESIKIKKWIIGNTVECMDLGDFQGFKIFQL